MVYLTPIIIVILGIIIYLFVNHYGKLKETFVDTVSNIDDWTGIQGKLKQVSVSGNRVCGVNDAGELYCSKVGTNEWKKKAGWLKHVSISGDKVCGVNGNDDIYCADNVDSPDWKGIPGKLKQIDLSGTKMCGVNSVDNIYCADYGKANWEQKQGQLKHISISGKKVCGTNANDDIYCADSLVDPQWKNIQGKLKQIDLSDNKMCGVNSVQDVYCADFAKDNWTQKPTKMDYVSIDKNVGYAIDKDRNINYAYDIDKLNVKSPEDLNKVSDIEVNPTRNILTRDGDTDFRAHEDRTCKYLSDNLKGEEQNYDIVKNYLLVDDPRDKEQCYVKDLSSIADGECSMTNRDLYDPAKHGDIVSDIFPNLTQDKYVSKTLPQNSCIIKFKTDGNAQPDAIKQYLSFIDNNIPKLKRINVDLQEANDFTDVVKDEIAQSEKEIGRLQGIVSNLDNQIGAKRNKIATEYNFDALKASVDNSKVSIRTKEDVQQQRMGLKSYLCYAANYGDCKEFPIGRYNVDQMRGMGMKNDELSSMKVPSGLIARFYSDTLDVNGNVTNPNNKYVEVDGRDIAYIGNERWNDGTDQPRLNDSISSVIIQAKPVDPAVPIRW
jgi:predicted RNA-binding protein